MKSTVKTKLSCHLGALRLWICYNKLFKNISLCFYASVRISFTIVSCLLCQMGLNCIPIVCHFVTFLLIYGSANQRPHTGGCALQGSCTNHKAASLWRRRALGCKEIWHTSITRSTSVWLARSYEWGGSCRHSPCKLLLKFQRQPTLASLLTFYSCGRIAFTASLVEHKMHGLYLWWRNTQLIIIDVCSRACHAYCKQNMSS